MHRITEQSYQEQNLISRSMPRTKVIQELLVYLDVNFNGDRKAAAKHFGVHYTDLSHALAGRRSPNDKILAKLGIRKKRVTIFIPGVVR